MRAFFSPHAVAVIGATDAEGSVGRQLVWNLLASPFGGAAYPVNPRRGSVFGVPAYPSPEALPEAPDLALVAVPADAEPSAPARAGASAPRRSCRTGSPGRREPHAWTSRSGPRAETAAGGIRVLGPGSLGTMRPWGGLNATFVRSAAPPRPGPVALFSQSGALVTAMLDWGPRENAGFSLVAALGETADLGWADLLDYAGQDGRTESVLLYLRTVGDARALLSAAREVAFQKPVLVLRSAQREPGGARALDFGLPVTRDAVLEAALRRTGVLRVDTIGGLFHLAEALAKAPRPAGPRLAIVSNARGPARLAADALLGAGGQIAPSPEAPPPGGAGRLARPHTARPEAFAAALAEAEASPAADGVLLVLAPQPGLDEETVYLRYAGFLALEGRVDHARLVRKCFIDYSREMALVAEVQGPEGPRLLGIGRLARRPGGEPGAVDGEFGLLVADDAQGQGVGTLLLSRLVRVGRAEGLARIYADVLRRNRPMQGVAQKLGFHLVHPEEASDPMVQVVLPLGEAKSPPAEA